MKIGELAIAARTQTETIRYYERAGLLPAAARSEGNYRVYEDGHVQRLSFIRHCRSLDMTLDEIRVLLRFKDAPSENCEDVNSLLDEHIGHIAARIRELKVLEKDLRKLRKQCDDASTASNCGILSGLDRAARDERRIRKTTAHISGSHKHFGISASGSPRERAKGTL